MIMASSGALTVRLSTCFASGGGQRLHGYPDPARPTQRDQRRWQAVPPLVAMFGSDSRGAMMDEGRIHGTNPFFDIRTSDYLCLDA